MNLLTILNINACANSGVKHTMVILGYILMVIKILVPVIIILMGMKNLMKAILNDDDIKKDVDVLIVRFFVGVAIFLIPTLVKVVFNQMIKTDVNNDFVSCTNCLFEPNRCYQEVLQQKEEEKEALLQKPTVPENPDKPQEGDGTYHINSVNGLKYNLYHQPDPRWADFQHIGADGCHLVSAAVVISAYDTSVTPDVVYKRHFNAFPYNSINGSAGNLFSCYQINSVDSEPKILESLKQGDPVVIMVYGPNKGGSNPFVPGQHYMALIDYYDGQIFVGNSFSNSHYGKSGWFPANEVLKSVREVNICEVKS